MWNGPYVFWSIYLSTFWGKSTSIFFSGLQKSANLFFKFKEWENLVFTKNIQILLSRKGSDWPLTIPLSCNTINTYKLFHKIYILWYLTESEQRDLLWLNHNFLISQVPVTFQDPFKPLFCLLPMPPLSLWFFSHDGNTRQREWRKWWLK